jgi:AraC-like DNA-binding protein
MWQYFRQIKYAFLRGTSFANECTMILHIRNMVGARCKQIVQLEIENLGRTCKAIEYGKITVSGTITITDLQRLSANLHRHGLELMDDKRSILIDKIKHVVIKMVHGSGPGIKVNFSSHLTLQLGLNYTYLANVFSEVEGITIERFIILHKIQKVKELIRYDELSLTEISWKLHYSSVAHLSAQFKNITGETPSQFKHTERLSQLQA